VISRAIIHIDGPPGAGKTAFVERLLGVLDEWVLAVRCRRDQSLRQARESPSARDPEVRRYRAAGASDAGRFTFPSGRDVADAFFTSRLLTDISDVVVIEGDSPLRDADLRVFVAPPPAAGQTLLVRERRDRAAQQRARAAAMERLLGEPDGAARLLEQLVGGPVVALARERPELLEQARASLVAGIGKVRTVPPPAPTEQWAIAGGYAGDRACTAGRAEHGGGCQARAGAGAAGGGAAVARRPGGVRRRAGLAWVTGADHRGRGRSGRPAARRDTQGGGPGEAEHPGVAGR
jgi:hypothetical protein